MKKKTKIILFTSLFLLVIIGAYFTINYYNNRLANKFSYVLEKHNGNTEDPARGFYGINDKGELTEIIIFDYPSPHSYAYDVLDNYLYYVHNNYLYKIDLLTDDYVPEKLFEVSVSFNLKMSDKYAYVAGAIGNENSDRLYSYDLETGKETELRENISAWGLVFDRKANVLYFNELIYSEEEVGPTSSNELYKYNLNDNSEKLILEDTQMHHMSEDKIYVRSVYPAPTINYVYDKKTEEITEFDIDMPYAQEYKNRILYQNGSKIMLSTYDGEKELVYDFKDVAVSVAKSLLLKDNLLVSVVAVEDNYPIEAVYDYYLLNLKTKKATKFSEEVETDYEFLHSIYNEHITIE